MGNASAGQQARAVFPQYLGDRFGWEAMTATVAGVYERLPPSERSRACIFTANYGEASALNLLGSRHHLPPAISGHNSYYLWGPGRCGGEVLITVGERRADLEEGYASVVRASTITCRYCMPEEDDLPVYVVRRPRLPVRALWMRAKHYD